MHLLPPPPPRTLTVIGPLTFRDSDAPQYIPAKITIVAILSVCMVAVLLLDLMYIRENKKRDREEAQNPLHVRDIEFMDLTDKENRHFRVRLSSGTWCNHSDKINSTACSVCNAILRNQNYHEDRGLYM